MPPVIAEFWKKLNSNEKMVMYGAIIVVIAFVLGSVSGYGYLGTGSGDLVAAIVVAVLYWLKYSPNKIAWPMPIQTIVLLVAGVSALFALLTVLPALAVIGSMYGIAAIVNAVGCGVMAWFAYKEYVAMPKATPPPAPPTPPAA